MDLRSPGVQATAPAVVVTASVVVEALTALAGAGSRLDVAGAALPPLLALPGVRAVAVVERAGADVVVQGSAGYGCASMSPGQRIPLDAGLCVTEAVRTDRTVVRGPGPSWVAAPFRRRCAGALLLSLDGAPPEDLRPVVVLARAVGQALERARGERGTLVDLAGLAARAPSGPEHDPTLEVVVRCVPIEGPVGGDVLLALSDGRAGTWLVAADVCGTGPRAALVARAVETAARALAPYASGPAVLLHDLERSLRPVVLPGSFVTALVVHVRAGRVVVASAGHPPPVLLRPSGASALDVPTGPPLALETGQVEAYEQVSGALPLDGLLLLHSDGLGDRQGARGTEPLDLVREVAVGDPSRVADDVLAAADRAGPASDDVALMVVRRRVAPPPPAPEAPARG